MIRSTRHHRTVSLHLSASQKRSATATEQISSGYRSVRLPTRPMMWSPLWTGNQNQPRSQVLKNLTNAGAETNCAKARSRQPSRFSIRWT